MAEEKESANVASEWPGITGRFCPTPEQKSRKKKTGSYYKRDHIENDYSYSKGPFV